MIFFLNNLVDLVGWGRYTWGYGPWGEEPNNVPAVEGVQTRGRVGTVLVSIAKNVSVSGVEATSEIGIAEAATGAAASGVQATFALSNVYVNVAGAGFAEPTGVSATFYTGEELVWGLISTLQVSSWQNVNDIQTPVWQNVVVDPAPVWDAVLV